MANHLEFKWESCTCVSKNAVATSSSTAAKSTSSAEMGDSSDGYIQLLNMVVEDKRTRNVFLKSFGVGRCEIPVPASNFDDKLPGWLVNAVEKEYTYHFALSLARYRAQSDSSVGA